MKALPLTCLPGLAGGSSAALVLLVSLATGFSQGNLDFSLDPLSPKVPGSFSDADVIESNGSVVRVAAGELGASGSGVIGLSYGQAEAADVNSPYYYKRLAYSVDRNATGNGAPIATVVAIDGAAGDTFALDFVGVGPRRFVLRRPFNLVKAQIRGLTLKADPADPEDDIDALSLYRTSTIPSYLTFPPGSGYDPAAIHIVRTLGGPPEVFATAAQLGLAAGDVIDAFALGSIPFGGPPPTALNPNVVIWISLASGSPTRGGADSIRQVWPTPVGTVLSANQLNLGPGDEINALAVLDPVQAFEVSQVDVRRGSQTTALAVGPGAGGGEVKAAFDVISSDANASSNLVLWSEDRTKTMLPVAPAGGIGQVQGDALAVSGTHVVGNIKAVAPGGWSIGEEAIEGDGTHLFGMDRGSDPPSLEWSRRVCEGPGVLTPDLNLFAKGGEPGLHLQVGGTVPAEAEGIATIGGQALNNGAEKKRGFCLTADLSSGPPASPMGMLFEGVAGGNLRDVQVTASDILVTEGPTPGSTVCTLSCAVHTVTPDLRSWIVMPDGLSAPMLHPNVNPGGGPAVLLVEFRIEGTAVTLEHIHPMKVVIGSNPSLEVRDIKMLPDACYVAVNSGGDFTFLGELHGEANNANSHLFELDEGSPPRIVSHFETDSPVGVGTEISGIAVNRQLGDLGVAFNTLKYPNTGPVGGFEFSFRNAANGSAAGIQFGADVGIEAATFCVGLESRMIGPIILKSRPQNLNDTYPYIIHTGIVACGGGFEIAGLSYSPDPVIDPTRTHVPVQLFTPPGEEHRIFSFVVAPPVTGEGPSIGIQRHPSGGLEIHWIGDRLECSDQLGSGWSTVPGAPNPYVMPIDGPAKFFRSYQD